MEFSSVGVSDEASMTKFELGLIAESDEVGGDSTVVELVGEPPPSLASKVPFMRAGVLEIALRNVVL